MAVAPKGSEELLIALQTPSPQGYLGVPVLIWGGPGEGKTSFIESLQEPEFPVVTLIASIHDPTDFAGLPIHEKGRTRFAPPEWTEILESSKRGGILLLDELTTAPPAVQAALLRVVLERKVGVHDLPSEVRIVAAANPAELVTGGWELTKPLANRFVHLQWSLDGATYANALRDGFANPKLPVIDRGDHREVLAQWRAIVEAFLRVDPSQVHTQAAEDEYAYASPRTWDYAIHLMASCEILGQAPRLGGRGKAVFFNLVKGCVGKGAAQSFVSFLKNMNLPNPDKVLDGKEQVDVAALKDDELYVLFASLATAVVRRGNARDGRYLSDSKVILTVFDEVNQANRVDTVFAPVRQMVRGKVLHRAYTVAKKEGREAELKQLLDRVFDDTPLIQYVEVLDGPNDS